MIGNPQAIAETARVPILRPSSPLKTKPRKGSRGIQRRWMSKSVPLAVQLAKLAKIDRFPAAPDDQQQRQADGRFSSGHCQHHQGKDLAAVFP